MPSQEMQQQTETTLLYDGVTFQELGSTKRTLLCLAFTVHFSKLSDPPQNLQKHHMYARNFIRFLMLHNWNRLMEKLHSNILEHVSYRVVVESWESVQANLNAPLLGQGTHKCLRRACTKLMATELMNVSGL